MIQLIVHQMVNQRSHVLLILSYIHTVEDGGEVGGGGTNGIICGRMGDHKERGFSYLMLR